MIDPVRVSIRTTSPWARRVAAGRALWRHVERAVRAAGATVVEEDASEPVQLMVEGACPLIETHDVAAALEHLRRGRSIRTVVTPPPWITTQGAMAAQVMWSEPAASDRDAEWVTLPWTRALRVESEAELTFVDAQLRVRDRASRMALLPRPLRALVMDFDGVFTDNKVLVNQEGVEAVRCDRGDGLGLGLLAKAGLRMAVISKERNPVTLRRCEKLGLECMHGVDDKPAVLGRWLEENRLDAASIVFIGNDVNDLGVMAMAGCSVAVADAHPKALAAAKMVLEHAGGKGALRELADLILDAGVVEPQEH